MSDPDSNLEMFPGVTPLSYEPSQVLRLADRRARTLEHVIVVGQKRDGGFYFVSSHASGPDCLWLLQQAINQLMAVGES